MRIAAVVRRLAEVSTGHGADVGVAAGQRSWFAATAGRNAAIGLVWALQRAESQFVTSSSDAPSLGWDSLSRLCALVKLAEDGL